MWRNSGLLPNQWLTVSSVFLPLPHLSLSLSVSLSLSLSLTHVCLHCACAQVDSAFGAYMEDPETMLFAIGSTVGPHP